MAEINYENPINRWLKYHQVTPARKLYRSSQVANERLAIKQPFWIHQMAGTLNNSQSVSQVSDSGETAVELLWTERRNGHKAAGEFQLLIQQGRRTLKGPSSHIITASARVAHRDYLICISNPSTHPSIHPSIHPSTRLIGGRGDVKQSRRYIHTHAHLITHQTY